MNLCCQCGYDLVSNPGFPFRICLAALEKKQRDKIWNGESGFKASYDLLVHSPLTTFSALALSKLPFSITLRSGLRRESVGATPSSISLREHTNSVKPYISSLPGLWRERKERGGGKGGRSEGVGREEGVRG